MDSPLGKDRMKRKIRDLLDKAWKKAKEFHMEDSPYQCCINTELNSTNFLIGGEGKPNYIIDWEKPLFGDPAQDLGHFLAPTTTFWKTDVILREEEIENFLNEYLKCEMCIRDRFLCGRYADWRSETSCNSTIDFVFSFGINFYAEKDIYGQTVRKIKKGRKKNIDVYKRQSLHSLLCFILLLFL